MNEEKKKEDSSIDLSEADYTLLLEWLDSKYFAPYEKLIKIRMLASVNGLASVDPFKEPTLMARYQGIRIGLNEPNQVVSVEKERRVTAEKGEVKK